MSTMVVVDPRYIRGHALSAPAKPEMKRYTLLAVQQGDQWASLCRELDIASTGATAAEALDTLERAVAEALDYERETGVRAGAPVPSRDLAAFLELGQGSARAQTRTVTL